MSETDDIEALGRRLLEKSRQSPVREQMELFVADHRPLPPITEIRDDISDADSLSDIVIEDRDERL